MVFHLAVGDLVEEWLVAPPLFVWHEGNRATDEVDIVDLVRASTPLWAQLAQVCLVELLGGVDLRRKQEVEQALPPWVCMLVGDHSLLVGLALGHRLDEIVTFDAGDIEGLILAVVVLPGVLEGLPVNRRAIVVLGLVVDGVGDDGLAVLLLFFDVGDVVVVGVELTGAVEKPDLRVVVLPHVAGIPGAVSVEWVFLLGNLIQCQAKFAAFLQLGAVLWIVGTVELDVDASPEDSESLLEQPEMTRAEAAMTANVALRSFRFMVRIFLVGGGRNYKEMKY